MFRGRRSVCDGFPLDMNGVYRVSLSSKILTLVLHSVRVDVLT